MTEEKSCAECALYYRDDAPCAKIEVCRYFLEIPNLLREDNDDKDDTQGDSRIHS